jgi:hypothetical protein
VNGGTFVYIREYPGRRAVLRVSDLKAGVGPVGSSAARRAKRAQAEASGILEGSGHFRLVLRARLFAEKTDADISLRLSGQDLAELNRFFEPSAGVRLKGGIAEARAEAAIRGSRLSSTAYLRYSGLHIEFRKTKERGPFASFAATLLAGVTVRGQNLAGKDAELRGRAALVRQRGEPLVTFALRGLKEPLLQVATQGGG